jgi:hypothetical protein
MIPVDPEVQTENVSDHFLANRFSDIGKIRRPAAVLVDRKPDSLFIRKRYKPFALIQIKHKWLLTEDMFSRPESRLDQRQPFRRMCGDIHYFDVVASEQVPEVCGDDGIREKLFLTLSFGFPNPAVSRSASHAR